MIEESWSGTIQTYFIFKTDFEIDKKSFRRSMISDDPDLSELWPNPHLRLKMKFIFFFIQLLYAQESNEKQPNIIFVVADDLGWADVNWNNKESLKYWSPA